MRAFRTMTFFARFGAADSVAGWCGCWRRVRPSLGTLALLLSCCVPCLPVQRGRAAETDGVVPGRGADAAAVRRFVFRYRFQLKHLDRFLAEQGRGDRDAVVRIWVPLAQSTRFQQVVSPFAPAVGGTAGDGRPAASSASRDRARDETSSADGGRGRGGAQDIDSAAPLWDPEAAKAFLKGNRAVLPGPARVLRDPVYGNRILFVEFVPKDPRSPVTVEIPYCVARREVRSSDLDRGPVETLSDAERRLFLRPNAKVPVGGKPLSLLEGTQVHRDDPLQLARDLYRVVDANVTYKKVGSGWGEGDVLWVCDSRYGNCTDFHSLFISLARALGIPAKFVIGFPVPREPASGPIGGYHCWAWFYAEGRGWRPVDISEADKNPQLKEYYFGNLTADRLQFTTGRDIDLNRLVCEPDGAGSVPGAAAQPGEGTSDHACQPPRSVSAPLNYFIYPHVEIGGRVLDRKFVVLQMSYCNVDVECLCAALDRTSPAGGD